MFTRQRKIVLRQRLAAERQMRADVLAERRAFAAFPRLEFPSRQQFQRLRVLAGLVVERAQFHGQIVALRNEVRDFSSSRKRLSGFSPSRFQSWSRSKSSRASAGLALKRLFVGGAGLGRFLRNVEIADAEIAPDDGKVRVQLRAAFPEPDGFLVAAAVVKQVAQVIRRAGVARVGAHGGFENRDFLQPRRETIIRRFGGSALVAVLCGSYRRQSFSCSQPSV